MYRTLDIVVLVLTDKCIELVLRYLKFYKSSIHLSVSTSTTISKVLYIYLFVLVLRYLKFYTFILYRTLDIVGLVLTDKCIEL
jgi:hypothetical protein